MPCISWIVTDWMGSWRAHDARSGIVDDQPATGLEDYALPGGPVAPRRPQSKIWTSSRPGTDRQAIGKVEAVPDVQAGAIVPQVVE